MDKKHSVGDKVVTADDWNNVMGRIIPKGSVVEIIRAFEYDGINMYDCEYNGDRIIYEEPWLGEKYVQTQNGGWIPCSERLPDTRNNILICQRDGYVSVGYYSQDKFLDLNSYPFEDVIAWQPLPEAYHG